MNGCNYNPQVACLSFNKEIILNNLMIISRCLSLQYTSFSILKRTNGVLDFDGYLKEILITLANHLNFTYVEKYLILLVLKKGPIPNIILHVCFKILRSKMISS